MKTESRFGKSRDRVIYCVAFFLFFLFAPVLAFGQTLSGEAFYKELLDVSKSEQGSVQFRLFKETAESLVWEQGLTQEFEGNLRVLHTGSEVDGGAGAQLLLIRKLSGELFILSESGGAGFLENPETLMQNKLRFSVQVVQAKVNGRDYPFARFTATPYQPVFDRVFKISIILMLFFIMLGMGMTLTLQDFRLVFFKPKAVLLGVLLQFGVMPFLAFLFARVAGYYEAYPYIYIGMILVAASPGGVTSNLMTHFAKGDLALSISLTSFSTVLSLFFTPLLLALYCTNVPEVEIPVGLVASTITVLVILPLILGMLIRSKWKTFARKATPYFSALGIVTVLFIMVAGVLSNLDKFADIHRYDLKFYLMVFVLTVAGMVAGALVPKLFGVDNYQVRAVSLETGLRNSSLAMTLAILIQDQMGDFFSSMFVVSGVFGLEMYVAGLIAIVLYKKWLPISTETLWKQA
ncbi:MAG: bile acid:sodium symporter family protein [Desulfatibacillum sp.]|nr:bile acid:sodium symporter family protein [Desulfatibacillum sp.]